MSQPTASVTTTNIDDGDDGLVSSLRSVRGSQLLSVGWWQCRLLLVVVDKGRLLRAEDRENEAKRSDVRVPPFVPSFSDMKRHNTRKSEKNKQLRTNRADKHTAVTASTGRHRCSISFLAARIFDFDRTTTDLARSLRAHTCMYLQQSPRWPALRHELSRPTRLAPPRPLCFESYRSTCRQHQFKCSVKQSNAHRGNAPDERTNAHASTHAKLDLHSLNHQRNQPTNQPTTGWMDGW